ncbi:GPI-anchored wall transfer protein 1, putative [Plasmodium berghei]|uniref:GPI-anchored wall transfer protein 1, putative n=2 Tax=Plasmodium berghei TaxID=5821 RepID=A0A509AMH4_PLABA|nr:GPI-anchored wall transfer protein 1, putative [Plasmodium berghei ANKA]CXI80015.1 GPI-anchored wall transfer protein 1, putative [Plasmodium berghei]SCM25361.1 GPI-anchored wall transfer protein 1, putative [Plasmodium berghei]SCN27344.1 GPI-anchored wall transfer protein 1, putative [Plasmodium berghei]SCO61985.1 GPI-anchored wall transfer protein 1, putative [Plasmodium berghei]SCO63769.1 GPI-anchored wall transfer protein 1, putative [Plasmodium berghei]|eukprot:XP_034422978.1 GPI-anchored wall transfer protein 1, putative [Plasmodium berghei ANKA]
MKKINLISYLFSCPLNVTHILDPVFYMHEINKNANNNNYLFTYYNKNMNNEIEALYNDKHLHEVSQIFFQLSQKYKSYFEKKGKGELNIVDISKNNNDDRYKFKGININEKEIYFLYEIVKTKEIEKIRINESNKVSNYLNLLKNDSCVYKLNTIEYNKIKNMVNHSNDIVLNTYYIYLLLLFFSLCIYIEKSLFIIFPILRKWEIIMTLFIILIPSIIYLFLFFYFTITNVISLYIFFYFLFYAFTHKWKNKNKLKADDKVHPSKVDFMENKRKSDNTYNCLIHTRVINMCITCLCIFAVDFFFFPKHFKKSAYYGNTLMDLGIGACITTSAYSYKKKDKKVDINSGSKQYDEDNITNERAVKYIQKNNDILKFIIKYFTLFILGIGRFFAITFFNYNYSITEYGIHWNFFLTLFFLLIITNIIFNILKNKKKRIFIFSCISIAIYELFIHIFDIHSYILLKEERNTFFEANKEGIFNLIGSINLYTFSYSFWNIFIVDYSEEQEKKAMQNIVKNCEIEKKNKENLHEKSVFNNKICNDLRFSKDKYYSIYLNIKLFFFAFIFYILHWTLNKYEKYSVRVLCNANYIFIISSISMFMASLSYIIEQIITEQININILDKINSNTLTIFLFCNITLGIFNILFQSLLYPLVLAIFILILYSLFFLIFANFLPIYSRRKT